MIIYLQPTDGQLLIACIDDTVILDGKYVEEVWTLPAFLTEFPSFPYEAGIKSCNYEPDRDLYHVSDGNGVHGFNRPEEHPMLLWFHNNRDAIRTSAATKMANTIAITTGEAQP